jgi:hypothetical protein
LFVVSATSNARYKLTASFVSQNLNAYPTFGREFVMQDPYSPGEMTPSTIVVPHAERVGPLPAFANGRLLCGYGISRTLTSRSRRMLNRRP